MGLYTVSDPSESDGPYGEPIFLAYGRYLLPPHPPHLSLIQDPAVSHTYRRIFLPPYEAFPTRQEAYDSTAVTHAEDVELTADELRSGLARGGRWVFYSIWEVTEEPKGGWEAGGRGRGRDMVLIHGR